MVLAKWVSQIQPIINAPNERKQTNAIYQKLFDEVLIFTHFDLLMAGYEKITAINWSMGKFIASDQLQNNWLTQLGLFLLVENEQVLPENVSIIHCCFNPPHLPTIYHFSYSQSQHDSFKERLKVTLLKLPVSSKPSECFLSSSVDRAELNLQKLGNGEISILAYLDTIPEVEI